MPTKPISAKTLVIREVKPLGEGACLTVDPTTATLPEVVLTYAVLNHLSKVIEAKKKALKPHLLAQAATHGELTDKGHRLLSVGQEKVIRERKLTTDPNEENLRTLLLTKKIAIIDAFDEIKAMVVSPSKLEFLVSVGKLTKDEVEALRDESFSCKVVEGADLKELLDAALGEAPEAEPEYPAKKRARR